MNKEIFIRTSKTHIFISFFKNPPTENLHMIYFQITIEFFLRRFCMMCSARAGLFFFSRCFFFWQISQLRRLTKRRQFVLHLQHHSLPDVLQQADNLIMAKLRQVDAVHRLDVISHVQLVAPAASHT